MVDVSDKDITNSYCCGRRLLLLLMMQFMKRIAAGTIKKGDVLSVAQLAAIMGAKQTSNLIPLCHPLALTKVEVHCTLVAGESPACTDATHNRAVKVHATVKTTGKTGVEMGALTAVQVGLFNSLRYV